MVKDNVTRNDFVRKHLGQGRFSGNEGCSGGKAGVVEDGGGVHAGGPGEGVHGCDIR